MKFFIDIISRFKDAGVKAAGREVRGLQREFLPGQGRRGRGGFGGAADMALAAQGIEDLSRKSRAGLGIIFNAYGDYEAGLDAVEARFQGTASEIAAGMMKIDERAKLVGKDIKGTSAIQALGAAEFMATAGWSGPDIDKALTPMAKFSKAMGQDLGRTADVVSDVMGQFDIGVGQLPKTLGQLTVGINSANMDLNTFFEAAKQGGPVIKALGGDLAEFTAITGALANVGIKGSLAGTAQKGMLRILDPRGKKGRQAAERLGLGQRDLKRKGVVRQDGSFSASKMFAEMAKDAISKGRGGVDLLRDLTRAFGREALPSVAALLAIEMKAQGAKMPKELLDKAAAGGVDVEKVEGAKTLGERAAAIRAAGAKELNTAYAKKVSNAKASVEALKSELSDLAIVAGGQLAPLVEEMIPELKAGAAGLGEWITNNKETVKSIFRVVGVLAVLGPVLTPVILGLATLKTAMALLGGAGGLAMQAANALGASGLGGQLKGLVGKGGTLLMAAAAFYSIRDGALSLIEAGKEAHSLAAHKEDVKANITESRKFESTDLRKSLAKRSTDELNAFLAGQGLVGEDGKRMHQKAGSRSVTARLEKSTEGSFGRFFGAGAGSTLHYEGGAAEQALRELIARGDATDLQRAKIVAFDTQRKVLGDAEGSRPEDHRIQSKVEAEVSKALAGAKLQVDLRVDKKGRIEVSAQSSDANVATTQTLDTGLVQGA